MNETTAGVVANASPDPLDGLAARESAVVMAVTGGRGFVSRLATLGFVPGARVTMVQNYGRGAVIVAVRQTRIALGRGQAAKVSVRREACR